MIYFLGFNSSPNDNRIKTYVYIEEILKYFQELTKLDVSYFEEFKNHPFWKNYLTRNNYNFLNFLINDDIKNPWIELLLNHGVPYNQNEKVHFRRRNEEETIYFYNLLSKYNFFKLEESIKNKKIVEDLIEHGSLELPKLFWKNGLFLDIFENNDLLKKFLDKIFNKANLSKENFETFKNNITLKEKNKLYLYTLFVNNYFGKVFLSPYEKYFDYFIDLENELISKNLIDKSHKNFFANNINQIIQSERFQLYFVERVDNGFFEIDIIKKIKSNLKEDKASLFEKKIFEKILENEINDAPLTKKRKM